MDTFQQNINDQKKEEMSTRAEKDDYQSLKSVIKLIPKKKKKVRIVLPRKRYNTQKTGKIKKIVKAEVLKPKKQISKKAKKKILKKKE